MAVKLSANYSKKLGLPQYSSHSFSASVEIELTDISQVEEELRNLYGLLQHSVDQEIQSPGFVPTGDNNRSGSAPQSGRSQSYNGHSQSYNGHSQSSSPHNGNDRWACTDGQRGFILRIVSDNRMDKQEAEDLSHQLFGLGVKQLNKMQASQLIEDLLVKAGKPARQSRWQQRPTARAA